MKKYEVTLRRDVQQCTTVIVQALSKSDAIATAEAVSGDADAWQNEEIIGVRSPKVRPRK